MFPYLFKGSQFQFPVWNFCLLLGFVIAVVLAVIKKPNDLSISRKGIVGLSFIMLVFAVLGTKILFVFLNFEILKRGYSFIEYLKYSGYTMLGGIFGEIVAIFVFTKFRKNRISYLEIGDYFMPFLMLQLAFVRLGCFFNGCCYGTSTNLFWGCVFLPVDSMKRHPTQLYASMALLLNFIVMRHFYKKDLPRGAVLWGTLSMYSALRFFVEIFRVDSPRIFSIITLTQSAMIVIFIISVFFLRRIILKTNR